MTGILTIPYRVGMVPTKEYPEMWMYSDEVNSEICVLSSPNVLDVLLYAFLLFLP